MGQRGAPSNTTVADGTSAICIFRRRHRRLIHEGYPPVQATKQRTAQTRALVGTPVDAHTDPTLPHLRGARKPSASLASRLWLFGWLLLRAPEVYVKSSLFSHTLDSILPALNFCTASTRCITRPGTGTGVLRRPSAIYLFRWREFAFASTLGPQRVSCHLFACTAAVRICVIAPNAIGPS